MITRGLKAFGVDMSSVLIEPGKISPTSFILVDERTGRRLVRYTRGSTTALDPGELHRKLLDGARFLLVDGRNPATHIAAAERARAQGVSVVLDARRLGGGMGELLDLSDIVIGNEEEVDAAGIGEVPVLVLKRGERGATVVQDGEETDVPGFPVDVVNGLGAGDAFAAALGHALLRGGSLVEAVRRGTVAGAIVASRLACSDAMPRADELEAALV